MAEEEKKLVESTKTPSEKEVEKNEEKVKKVANLEDDDDLIVEEDGDLFWIIQQTVWGIFKTLIVLSLILGTLWLIWGNKSFLKKNKKPEKKAEKEITEITEEHLLEKENEHFGDVEHWYAFEIANLAYELENSRLSAQPNLITDSIFWLKEAKSLGEISPTILRIQSPVIRAQKIEETLVKVEAVLDQSGDLKKRLQQDINEFAKKNNRENERILELDEEIRTEIRNLEPQNINDLLWEKIKAQKLSAEYASQGKIRTTLYQNIHNFDQLLRTKALPMFNPATELRAKKQY